MDTLYTLSDLKKYDNLELLAKQVVEGYIVGLHKSPLHGFSVEFAEHRPYHVGDDFKNVDWKVYARTEKLVVKEFEEETNLRCQLILDCSSSMYFPRPDFNKLMFSVYASAALMHVSKKQRDAVGLTILGEQIMEHTVAKSNTKHHRYLTSLLHQTLATTPNKVKTNLSDSLHLIAEQLHKRSLVIIFSDMYNNTKDQESLFSALQHLKHNKHEVVVFHVMDQNLEIDLKLNSRPYKLVDMETGQSLKLNPNDVIEEYRKNMTNFLEDLKINCGVLNIDFVPVDINKEFSKVLIPYFLKRSKMP